MRMFDCESITCTVNGEVPGVVGVPEMMPLFGSRFKPSGNVPEECSRYKAECRPRLPTSRYRERPARRLADLWW